MQNNFHGATTGPKKRGGLFLVLGGFLAGIGPLAGEPLRFEAALALALEAAQVSELKAASTQAARARIQAAKALPNPSAIAEHEYLEGAPGDSDESLIGISSPLDFLWKRGARIESAEQFGEIAPHHIAERGRQVGYHLAQVYLAARVAAERLNGLTEVESRLQEAYQISESLVANGEIPPTHRQRIAFAVEQVVAEKAALEADAINHQAVFTTLTGLETAEPASLVLSPPAYPTAEAAIAAATANRPDLKALDAMAKWRRREVDRSAAEALPEASLDVAYRRDHDSREGGFIGLSVEIPIFAKNRANQQLARSEAFATEVDLNQLRRQIHGQVSAAFQRYQTLSPKNAPDARADNESYLTSELSAFRQGETSVVEYLNAIQVHREMLLARINHRHLGQQAALDLIFQTGSPYPSLPSLSTTAE